MKNKNKNLSLLSDRRILYHYKEGNVIISPFKRGNLGTTSYDVSLGKYYFREQKPKAGYAIYSPWSKKDIDRIWGKPQKAILVNKYLKTAGCKLPEGIKSADLVIWISPGETLLCHTQEFIGGQRTITTSMKARSSLGRNFIEVCKCAGWGDVGYINRWTMEVTNNSRYHTIPLVVGRRMAQIVFFEVDPILSKDYSVEGKYQKGCDLKKIKKNWKPEDMLPKMWKDKEVKE